MSEEKKEKKESQGEPKGPELAPLDWMTIEEVLTRTMFRVAYLWGPPGVGKTYAAYHYGAEPENCSAVTLTEDTAASELRGHYVPIADGLEWRDGPFTRAMREGARLVVNEIHHAPPEVLSLLYPVLESPRTARLTLPTGETVVPAAGFHVILTDNLPPDELPEALQDRFECVIHIRRPHPDSFVPLRPILRRAAERTFALDVDRRVGMRKWLIIERVTSLIGLELSCRLVLGDERGRQIHEAIRLAGENEEAA